MLIYLNAKYVNVSAAEFDRLLPGNLDGSGAFETMRMYKGHVHAFTEHMDRLKAGLKHFRLHAPLSLADITSVIKKLSRRTGMVNARVRVIVWRDQRTNISISLQKLKLPKAGIYQSGFRVKSVRSIGKGTVHPDVKSVDYRFFKSALASAAKEGFDEVVFFNKQGHLVEGSKTNIFFIKKGILYTPSLDCGCLNGITRSHVIACARELSIKVQCVKATFDQLIKADEAFLSGSTLEIMPVKSVDRCAIGKKRPGPITGKIRKQYARKVKESLSV